jgi:hypothetical protein
MRNSPSSQLACASVVLPRGRVALHCSLQVGDEAAAGVSQPSSTAARAADGAAAGASLPLVAAAQAPDRAAVGGGLPALLCGCAGIPDLLRGRAGLPALLRMTRGLPRAAAGASVPFSVDACVAAEASAGASLSSVDTRAVSKDVPPSSSAAAPSAIGGRGAGVRHHATPPGSKVPILCFFFLSGTTRVGRIFSARNNDTSGGDILILSILLRCSGDERNGGNQR